MIHAGAVAKRLDFKGSGESDGFWNRGISACAVCDGAAPMFRKAPLVVIGGKQSYNACALQPGCLHSISRALRQDQSWK